jgi:restriction endonuclease S subunit
MKVKLEEVCKRIYAGGDVPKDRYSAKKTDIFNVPIYANAEKDEGLYGFTDCARETELSITVAARGTIGYTAIRREPFLPVVRLITVVPDLSKVTERYLFYALKNINLQSSGTSIPQLTVPEIKKTHLNLIDINEQALVTNRLDKVENLIRLKKQELDKLDELIKARFVEMFNNKGYPILRWNEVFDTTTGKLDSNAMVEDGEYPFFTCAKEVFRIDKYAFDQEALLLAGNNAAGKYDVKYYNGKFNAYQRTYVLGLKEKWSYRLFQYQLEDKLLYLQQQSLGGLTKYLTLKILGDLTFIVPPINEQNEFTSFVNQIDKSKVMKRLRLAHFLFADR